MAQPPRDTCTGTLAPFAGSGINFLLTNNSDPVNSLDNQYNSYHVPTDFEYVGLHADLGHSIALDVKPYTYNYDNSEKYSNTTPITEATTVDGIEDLQRPQDSSLRCPGRQVGRYGNSLRVR